MKKRILLFAISLTLLVGLIYFSNPGEVAKSLLDANYYYILLGAGLWCVLVVVRTIRWKVLLDEVDVKIPFFKTMKFHIMGLFLSNMSPGKAAEPVKAAFIKRVEDESFSHSMSSVLIERTTDLIGMAIITFLGLFWVVSSTRYTFWAYIALGVYTTIALIGAYLIFSGNKLERFLNKLISVFSFLPRIEKLEGRAGRFARKLRNSLRMYRSKAAISVSVFLSLIIWIINGLILWAAFLAVGVDAPILMVIVVKTISTLIAVLTFLPGSLGSGEIIRVALFSGLLAADVSVITSGVLIGRVLNLFIYAFVGAVLLTTVPKEAVEW